MVRTALVLVTVGIAATACNAFGVSPMGLMGRKTLPLSVSRRKACGPVMMSDLGDMTMEMLKRLSGSMDQLSEQDLAKLKSLCDDVSSKASSMSGSAASISSAPAPRSFVPPPAKKSSGGASNAPMPAFVIGTPRNPDVERDSDAYFGINNGPVDESGDPIKPKGAQQWQQPNKPKEPVAKPIEGDSKRFSKYLPDERPASVVKLATDESLFDEDTWNEEYKKVFGRLDPEVAMTDVESLNAPRGASADKNDSFRKVREVQANANSYATSDEYYAALSSAMNEWKRAKQAQGEIIGSAVSDRYMDQLANSSPSSSNLQKFGEKKKFTLDAMLNPVDAQDENGKAVKVLQFTEIDEYGGCGIAGVQVGEALIVFDGKVINDFKDLQAAIGEVHKKGLSIVDITIQGKEGLRELKIRGN